MYARAATAQENAAAPSNASSGAATGGGSCARANPPVKQERRAAEPVRRHGGGKVANRPKEALANDNCAERTKGMHGGNSLRRLQRRRWPNVGLRPKPSARTIRYNVRWPSAQSMALGPTRGPRPVRYATTRTLCGKMQLDRVASCTSRSAPDLGMPQRRAH
jgi:hypothetical protein